nr:fimbria/pilus periplasmic chaperone [Intestinirhabdus alba]
MTISGTRIVFPGTQSDQTVRTNNKGNTPIVAQVWVDDGSKDDNLSNINVPFTVTPPVFRVEPGKGQSVRLIYNGMSLPQDRESVFWFNLLEIPPVNEEVQQSDRLELAFRTRIKIFYRPTSLLKSSSAERVDDLRWERAGAGKGVKVTNPTPYYFSFDSAYITAGTQKYPLVAKMIPPFSSETFLPENKARTPATLSSVTFRLINDYGGVNEYQLSPTAGSGLAISKRLE